MTTPALSRPLPSHQTKHISLLKYPLWPPIDWQSSNVSSTTQRMICLKQDDACSTSTGATLWLSSQVLSAYLLTKFSRTSTHQTQNQKLRAVEIGAGTGLVSITLSALGYSVLATDIEPTLSRILLPNARHWSDENRSAGQISVCHLDWATGLDWLSIRSSFSNPDHDQTRPLELNVAPDHNTDLPNSEHTVVGTEIDLMVTADTIYAPNLIRPLLKTLEALSDQCSSPPTIYMALERREPNLVDDFFRLAVEMGFRATQVEMSYLRKLAEGMEWEAGDWEGVELWKLIKKSKRRLKTRV